MSDQRGGNNDPFQQYPYGIPPAPPGWGVPATEIVRRYAESQLPGIPLDVMAPDDVLSVTFADGSSRDYHITSLGVSGSVGFGNDGLNWRLAHAEEVSPEGDRRPIKIVGSSLHQTGGFFAPGNIRVGSHLNLITDKAENSATPIRDFTLKRPDDGGDCARLP